MKTERQLTELSGKSYNLKGIFIIAFLSLIYLFYSYKFFGFKSDHLFLVAIVNVAFILNGATRRFILAFSIFIVYWILYDSMKLYPNYNFVKVDIQGLYELEKTLFGFSIGGVRVTPNEYYQNNHNALSDAITAFFYLTWIPAPLLFAFYLFKKFPAQFLRFSLAFFVTNIVGFIFYYVHPAAPPWYVELHGFKFHEGTRSFAAGLLRFDEMAGFQLFENMYTKGSNVFAAMPSLHSAYPVIALYYSYKLRQKYLTWIFLIFTLGIWFSAIYLNHHYILDVIAGLLCAIFSILVFEKIILKNQGIVKWMSKYERVISKKD